MKTAVDAMARRPVEHGSEIAALGARIAEVSALADVLDHERLRCIRRFDELGGWAKQGARSCAHWLSWRVGLGAGAAREQVRVARALGDLPLLDAALARGEVSYSKVRAMTRTATPENEAAFLEMARHATATQIEVLSRKLREVVDPTAPSAERFFKRHDLESGMVRLVAQLRPEEAAVVMKALEVAIRMAHDGAVSAGTYSSADALVSIFESFLADAAARTTPVPGRYEVVLHVAEGTLEAKDDEPCELADGSRVSAETGRRLACGAPIVEVVERGSTATSEAARRTRRPSIAQRRALHERDRTCRFPGCTCRFWVDAHHVRPWSRRGETKVENLVQLCKTHHVLVHEGGFRVAKDGEGFLFFDRSGDGIPSVPRSPVVPLDGLERIARDHAGVGAETNAPLGDGSPLDYGAAVDGLLANA
jgi:hypothetical protein